MTMTNDVNKIFLKIEYIDSTLYIIKY